MLVVKGILRYMLAELLERVRLFWATVVGLIQEPDTFFARHFSAAGTRFNETGNDGNTATIPCMKPFAFLGFAIGISAVILTIAQYAILDLARENADLLQPGFGDLLERLRDMDPAARAAQMGLLYIDFAALTGIPILDPAIADAAQFAAYTLFAVLLWKFAPHGVTVKAIVHCFAYAVGLVIFGQAAVDLVLSLLQLTVGLGLQGFMTADFLFSLGFGVYVLAIPAYVLSDIFKVERVQLIKATLWAFGIWIVAGMILDLLLHSSGIWIRNFGLHLGL